MFKASFLFISLLLPLGALAQYQPGNYLLTDSRIKIYSGNILVRPNELMVKNDKNEITKFAADEVLYVRNSLNQRFITVSGFIAPGLNRNRKLYGSTLVELIDSGSICLTKYNNFASSSFSVSNGSGFYDGSIYIVMAADSSAAFTLPGYVWTNRGKKLYDALRHFASTRPDLLKILDSGEIKDESVPAFFHAINSGQPFIKVDR